MKDKTLTDSRLPIWKHVNNIEYIFIDFTGLNDEKKFIQLVEDSVMEAMKRPDKSVRAMVYLKNSTASPKAIRVIKKLGKQVQPKLKRSVVIGSMGIVSLLMKIYISHTGSKIKFFTDKEVALKYLLDD
ncbi:hypothetical protein [Tamlana sp. I1]|uniref:hypothetical protein n=1 Tax=Tamlana sp. I1 TaxID=2762061 RepID=UPI00189078CB|nr:hypothetical protein [Tamlana sp. I1]